MLSVLLFSTMLFIQQGANNVDRKGVAIGGYDPVSYFQGRPEKGVSAYSFASEGATFHFVSDENRSLFMASPQDYIPMFGGWCAYAMGDTGEKVPVDPETFKIMEGKLYLFYNSKGNNTLDSWNKNEKVLNEKAIINWKKINADL